MSSSNLQNKFNFRFKGLESFLRRVAFNLGNTPSQTEVKIISCIPIDVTDLQQKIQCLEKQLEVAKIQECNSIQQESVVQPVQTSAAFSRHSACFRSSTQVNRCEDCSPCNPACCTPTPPACAAKPSCTCGASDCPFGEEYCPETCSKGGVLKKKETKKKKPKLKIKKKCPTQLVYYAHTTTSPFNSQGDKSIAKGTRARDGKMMSRDYISEMFRKQYMPVPIIQDYAVGSEFSSPVCRDVEQEGARPGAHDSDVCSCCYGPFHNIDRHLPRLAALRPAPPTGAYDERVNNSAFYDTSLYDMIPVRERPAIKAKSYYETARRRSPTIDANSIYYPEKIRSKTKVHPYAYNPYGRAPTVHNHRRKTPTRMHSRKEKSRRVSPRREYVVGRMPPQETSDSCCIDCGSVYIKRIANQKPPKRSPRAELETPKPVHVALLKNAECLTNSILNDTECQTTTTQSVQIDNELLDDKKTEETLSQIKSILQSVLTAVKTNTLTAATQQKNVPEEKPKKDAVVQKGSSNNNMPGCSTLLHSYTYSPYNMNPYVASCSRQVTSGPFCFPNMPYTSGKCMHNYPVFIQTPPRHMCQSCYRNGSLIRKMGPTKPATTTATNTDPKERSKETEKLIKEIYKSITVNMDYPTKDSSASEYNGPKSTPRLSHNKSLYRASVQDDGMKNFVKANVQKSSVQMSSLDGKKQSTSLSTRSQNVSTTDTERRLRNRRLENYLATVEAQKRQNKIVEEFEEATPETTASDDESSAESTERIIYASTDTTRNAEPAKKTEAVQKTSPPKKSLFKKMFKSVKLFKTKAKKKKKEEEIQVNDEAEESENSDDYQTVYSQRVERAPRHIPYPVRAVRSPHRIKAHSKISYCRHMRDRNQERSRKLPYMEQEYRRHWNEKLMFHETPRSTSRDNRYSSETPSRELRRPAYWQNYEARSAMVGRRPTHRGAHSPQQARKIRADVSAPNGNTNKGFAWLKNHKLGLKCGPQWKKLILEG